MNDGYFEFMISFLKKAISVNFIIHNIFLHFSLKVDFVIHGESTQTVQLLIKITWSKCIATLRMF